MASPIGLDPATWVSTTAAPYIVGVVYVDAATGRMFRYVKNSTDAVWIPGEVLVRASATPNAWVATACNGATQISALAVVGVAVKAIPVNNFGFALVDGDWPTVVDTNNAAIVGQLVNPAAATKGAIRVVSNVLHKPLGMCLATAAGGGAPSPVHVSCL